MAKTVTRFFVGLLLAALFSLPAQAQETDLIVPVTPEPGITDAMKQPVKKMMKKAAKKKVKKAIKKKMKRKAKKNSKQMPKNPSLSQPAPGSDTPEMITAPAETVVNIENFAYKPSPLNVKKGTTVKFMQKDAAPHTVTPSAGTSAASLRGFGSGTLNAATSEYTYTFDSVGSFDYFCAIHPDMKGQVVVSE